MVKARERFASGNSGFACVLRGEALLIEMANEQFEAFLGQSASVGQSLRLMLTGKGAHAFLAVLEDVYTTGAAAELTGFSVVLAGSQGNTDHQIDFSARPLRDPTGQVTGVLLQGTEFADSTDADIPKALMEAEAKFRAFFEDGTHYSALLTLQGEVIEANQVFLNVSDLSRRDVVGRAFWDCAWWNASVDQQAVIKEATEQAAQGSSAHRECSFLGAGNQQRFVDLVISPVVDRAGTVIMAAATGTDITDRKRFDLAAREVESRFRSMADSAPVLIWEADENGVTFVNQHYLTFFGSSFSDLKGMAWSQRIHEDDAGSYINGYRTAFLRRERYENPARFRRYDGEFRWLQTTGFPHFDVQGRFVGFVFSSSDVTDLKSAEEAQRELAQELKAAHRQKDEFLALLAHELRNPLAPLQSGLELIGLSVAGSPALIEPSAMMSRQLGHMVRLIDDLLDLSRIATNKVELRRSRVSLVDIVNAAVETAQPLLTAAGHTLNISLPRKTVELHADLTRLAQVLSNLLINSAKYTPQGGVVSLAATLDDTMVEISVSDTGVGIPASELTSIFKMFSQVDRSKERATGGLGIGLALVKGFTELHGGTVVARSAGLNAGSTFIVRIPLPAENGPATSAQPPAIAPPLPQRVLVVDDNRDAALSLATLLRLRGNDVLCVHDGYDAIEQAERFRPDVVLMDIGMPELSGYEVTRRIRQQPWGQSMLIIALTGWGQLSDRTDSRNAGCNAHLVKPAKLNEIEDVMSTFVGKRP